MALGSFYLGDLRAHVFFKVLTLYVGSFFPAYCVFLATASGVIRWIDSVAGVVWLGLEFLFMVRTILFVIYALIQQNL